MNADDTDYQRYLDRVNARIAMNIAAGNPIFQTRLENLYDVFLHYLPEGEKQFHRCSACRTFVDTFGTLVTVDSQGNQVPLCWDSSDAPGMYRRGTEAMVKLVRVAVIGDVFFSPRPTWGTPRTPGWIHYGFHYSAHVPATQLSNSEITQRMAEYRTSYEMLRKGLRDFPLAILEQTAPLLRSGTLLRWQILLSQLEWLIDVQKQANTYRQNRKNILWYAVAKAPAGYARAANNALGVLLRLVSEGAPHSEIRHKMNSIMDPTQYQVAQAPARDGQIERAERVFKTLGLAPSLPRRYATHDDLQFFWKPATASASASGGTLFGHLKKKNDVPPSINAPVPAKVTWAKLRKIIPTAKHIEVKVPTNANRFAALVTAENPKAPNMLQWRTPVSWYYAGGTIDAEIKRRLDRENARYDNVEGRVSLMWNTVDDLDLYILTPAGESIWYNRLQDSHGGWLDVDMNAGSPYSTTPVENVRWERMPEGKYSVYVNLYRERTGTRIPFTVEISVAGQVFTLHGSTNCENSVNYASRMEHVTTFTYRRLEPVVIPGAVSSHVDQWNVVPNTFVPVTGIVRSPNTWEYDDAPEQHVFFLLEGCKDSSQGKGRGLHASMLRNDLREVRSVIDNYYKDASISGDCTAAGVGISTNGTDDLVLKVDDVLYTIDRWE